MSAFEKGKLVESRGMAILLPFLEEQSDGRLILLDKGPLALSLQETLGDAIFSCRQGRAWSVEIKIEEENKYGNLFLETWSNKNLEERGKYIARGNNPGWMMKVHSDLLLYYFIRSDDLIAADLFKLKRWAFGACGLPGNIYRFPEKVQNKYSQLNDTWGRVVPIDVLEREVGVRRISVKQLSLPTMAENAFELAN